MGVIELWNGKSRQVWLERATPWQRGFWFERDQYGVHVGLGSAVLHAGVFAVR